jgi:hypothetical protein
LAQTKTGTNFALYIAQSIRESNGTLDTYWDEGKAIGLITCRHIKR